MWIAYTIHIFISQYNMKSTSDIKECNRIKVKSGRIGTVMGIYTGTTGLEVEFSDNVSETETIDIEDVEEIIYKS